MKRLILAVTTLSLALSAYAEDHLPELKQRLERLEARLAAPTNALPIGLVLMGGYRHSSNNPSTGDGFSLRGTELSLSTPVDPYFRARLTAAVEEQTDAAGTTTTELAIEEAAIEAALGDSALSLTAGRFLTSSGYLSQQHRHAWDFDTSPLVYQSVFGPEGYRQNGLRLSWVAPTELLLRLSAELGNGQSWPGNNTGSTGYRSSVVTASVGGDVGREHSWLVGLSEMNTKASALADQDDASYLLDADNRIRGLYGVWKWQPSGRKQPLVQVVAEYLERYTEGQATKDNTATNIDGRQNGAYLSAQWRPVDQWRLGLRWDQRHWSTLERLKQGGDTQAKPEQWSAVVAWSGSEFSSVALEYTRNTSGADTPISSYLLRYQVSLGAHQAHRY